MRPPNPELGRKEPSRWPQFVRSLAQTIIVSSVSAYVGWLANAHIVAVPNASHSESSVYDALQEQLKASQAKECTAGTVWIQPQTGYGSLDFSASRASKLNAKST